jgi:hypothetical protein
MAKRSMCVGMDVHKESIAISLAEEGRDGEVRHYGGIPGDLEALAKVVKALPAPTRRLRVVYEAGPCRFGIHRYLTAQGGECVVVHPSSMPKRSGDRIKTDRRDGDALARLHRAGELMNDEAGELCPVDRRQPCQRFRVCRGGTVLGSCHMMTAVGFTRWLACGSARLPSPRLGPRLPTLRILPAVDRQHDDLIIGLPEVHGVRKALQDGASGLIANGWKGTRSLDHSRQHSLEVVDEPVAQTTRPTVVP